MIYKLPLNRGSCALRRAYCSGVMQVHCGSRPVPDAVDPPVPPAEELDAP